MCDRLKAALKTEVERRESYKARPQPKIKAIMKSETNTQVVRAPEPDVSGVRSRFIPVSVKRGVTERSGGRYEFVDPVSGRRCASRLGSNSIIFLKMRKYIR